MWKQVYLRKFPHQNIGEMFSFEFSWFCLFFTPSYVHWSILAKCLESPQGSQRERKHPNIFPEIQILGC